MKFANVDGQRREAEKGLAGNCPICAQRMTAKCGEIVIHHWAHYGRRECDPWWENESEWHRRWKGLFPESWQEVVHSDANGTKHIADIKTERGWAIEFQHSHISPEERRSRDAFYGRIIWVVDGTRLQSDAAQFASAWGNGMPLAAMPFLRRLPPQSCRLVREWATSQAPIFFDFGIEHALWWLLPGRPDGATYVACFSRTEFVASHRSDAAQKGNDFDDLVKNVGGMVADYEARYRALTQPQSYQQLIRRHRRF